MTKAGLRSSAFRRRALGSSFVVVFLTTSFSSPLFAGFIQTTLGLRAETEVTVVAPFGVISDADFETFGSATPPFVAFLDANAGVSGAGANAAIDASGNFGLRTFLTSPEGRASAFVTYGSDWRLTILPTDIQFVWFIGPLDIVLEGARDATVTVKASTLFNSVTVSALLTLEIDPLGNVTSGWNVNGVDQGPLPFVTNGGLVSLTAFNILIPVDFLETSTEIFQRTRVEITTTTGSAAPEGIFVGLDDPFNLSGDPATSVLFFEPPTNVVPEPSSLTLLASGMIGLCGYVWRRRRKSPSAAALNEVRTLKSREVVS